MTDAVAIVGMSGRFPGAPTLADFWTNLRTGTCTISDFDPDELIADGADPELVRRPDHVPSKGYLAGADRFEAELFGFTRAEATMLDPQHRLLLETAWAALEDAGFDPRRAPARTGVYVGGSLTEHMIAANTDRRLAAEFDGLQLRTLTDREFLAPWVSYRLGLDGPSITVQTACSTSLTAVHLATQALLLGECDAALAGGVALDSIRRQGYLYRPGGVYSPDGRCRPFDAKAAGTVGGNGVGLVVLRRLDDALADGDPVRAVILGSAVTNDGSAKVGFTAPGVEHQTAAIVEAWSAAGLSPSAAGYLEMHGTGTDLGDRIEIAAVTAAVGDKGESRCAIGSVKSNIGHLDAAAGVASLIKVVLMLGHRTVVPTAGVGRPHPDLAGTPLDIATALTAWDAPADGPRLAGVTAAGIGGTNVHVVLAEAPEAARTVPPAGAELLPISARTDEQVRAAAAALAAVLRSPSAPPLADVAHTLRTGRASLPARAWVVATTTAEAAERLTEVAAGRPVGSDGDADLRRLGAAWAAGADVTWPPTPGARRTHVPTYPFAGAPCGALTPDAPTPPTTADPEPAPRPEPLSEAAVADMLATALGLDGPDNLNRSFFAAGGDSLTAVHLLGRIRDDFGVDVPMDLFLEPMSLRELAARIAASGASGDDLLATLLDELESGP